MIQTIITDCDDTLLREDGTLSAYTVNVINRVQAKGVRVILASGRARASLLPIMKALGLTGPYIACNGSFTADAGTGEVFEALYLPVDDAKRCARFYEDNDMYAQFYIGDLFFYNKKNAYNRYYTRGTGLKGVYAGELSAAINEPIAKLLGIDEPNKITQAYHQAAVCLSGIASVVISRSNFLEMEPVGATKGEALARLARRLGIDPQTTIAFGDGINDMTMIQWAGYGVAVENAREEVRACARYICPPNTQDGVARMIEELVLKEGTHD